MIPREFRKLLDQIASQYQIISEENVRLKYTNDKLREELTLLNQKPPARSEKKKINYRDADIYIEDKAKVDLRMIRRHKFTAPINNIKVQRKPYKNTECNTNHTTTDNTTIDHNIDNTIDNNTDHINSTDESFYMAFSCNKKIFLYTNQTYYLISQNLITEYNPNTMRVDISTYSPLPFTFMKGRLLCCFPNAVVLYDLERLQPIQTYNLSNLTNTPHANPLASRFNSDLVTHNSGMVIHNTEDRLFICTGQLITELLITENLMEFRRHWECQEGIKQFIYHNERITYITSHSIGELSRINTSNNNSNNINHLNKIVDIPTNERNNTLFLRKSLIYVGGESSHLRVYVSLEQVNSIQMSKNIINMGLYLNNFMVTACDGGVTHVHKGDNRHSMIIRSDENVIDIQSSESLLFLLYGDGMVRVYRGNEIQRQMKKTVKSAK